MNLQQANYNAWLIDSTDFPSAGSFEDKINFLIGYGVLAPSTHNTQPWLIRVEGHTLVVAPNPERRLAVGDPNDEGLFISLGAFVENVLQAATAYGLTTSLKWLDADESLAVTFKENSASAARPKKQTLSALTERMSVKFPYARKAVADDDASKLEQLSTSEVTVRFVRDADVLSQITENHLAAAAAIAKNPAFARELAQWLRPNGTKMHDGMPGFVVGNPPLKSLLGKTVLQKKPEVLQKLVAQDRKLLESASGALVITVKSASSKNAFLAGQVLERAWLKLTELGLVAHPMYAAIQDPKARKQLAAILDTNQTPAFFLRVGYKDLKRFPVPQHTPRERVRANSLPSMARLAATLKSRPKSHQVQVGKYTINYITAGQGEPLLMIHGANIGWPQWHHNLDELAKNHKIYAIDLPGAGGSSKVTFRQTDFEKDYLDVVDAFVKKMGFTKVDVLGSSFGGWVAMRLAMAHKPYIRKLIVSNPIGFTVHMPMKFRPVSLPPLAAFMSKTALKPVRSNKNLEKFMRDVFYDKNTPLSPEFVDYFYELSTVSHNLLFISRLAHYSGMRPELFLGDKLSQIEVPTLIIWGKEDELMPYGSVKDNFKYVKGGELHVLEGVGHMPPVEAPETFNRLVTAFLQKG